MFSGVAGLVFGIYYVVFSVSCLSLSIEYLFVSSSVQHLVFDA